MSRNLSTPAQASVNARETGEVWLGMIELTHADFSAPIRLTTDSVDVTHDGNVYQAFPFDITLPDEEAEGVPVVDWMALNASQELTAEFRSVTGPIDGSVFWALASSPDIIEVGPMELQLRAFEYDAEKMSGTLVIEPVLDAVFGSRSMDNTNAPGLF